MSETELEILSLEDIPEDLRFSPSKLDAYHHCEQQAEYTYRLGLRFESQTTEALMRGKIMHRYLELWHRDGIHPNAAFVQLMEEFPTYEGRLLVTWCLTCMIRYVARYERQDAKRFKFITLEERVQAKLRTPAGREVYIDGIIDAIVHDLFEDTVGPWDHKTSGFNLWTRKAVVFNMQLNLYCVLLYLLGYTVNTATINQIYTGFTSVEGVGNAPQDRLFSRHTIPITPNTLDYWMELIGQKIDKIIEGYERRKEKHQGTWCVKCPFYTACEMDMLRKDPTPYLEGSLRPMVERQKNGTEFIEPEIPEGIFDE